jgi:hypothetical protein
VYELWHTVALREQVFTGRFTHTLFILYSYFTHTVLILYPHSLILYYCVQVTLGELLPLSGLHIARARFVAALTPRKLIYTHIRIYMYMYIYIYITHTYTYTHTFTYTYNIYIYIHTRIYMYFHKICMQILCKFYENIQLLVHSVRVCAACACMRPKHACMRPKHGCMRCKRLWVHASMRPKNACTQRKRLCVHASAYACMQARRPGEPGAPPLPAAYCAGC